MKTRLLPEVDLARITVLPHDRQLGALRAFKGGWPPYSYAVFRGAIFSICNVESPLFGPKERASWPEVARAIERALKKDDARAANLAVAEALYEFAVEHNISGRAQDFFPMAVGTSGKVRYWSPAVLSVDGEPTIILADPRKRSALSPEARRFAMSVMHERIRVLEPDYADVRLAVIQFAVEGEARRATLHSDAGLDLFGFDDLDRMVRQTYELWWQVQHEREEEVKRGTGTWGPLFGGE